MEKHSENIYKRARRAAGLTQERWAEFLGISVDSVSNYELGIYPPPEDVVLQMADISGMKILPYWHLSTKNSAGSVVLPELEEKRLPESLLSLFIQIEDFSGTVMRQLLEIGADGKVSDDEKEAFLLYLEKLDLVIRDAYAVRYAKETE